MGWSLLPDALRPFKIYCAPASPISVANRRNRSTGTCESCWSSPNLCPNIVRDSHSHRRCLTVSLLLRHFLHKGFISFPILYKGPFRPRCPVSRPITTDSCCLPAIYTSMPTIMPFRFKFWNSLKPFSWKKKWFLAQVKIFLLKY